MSDSLDSLAKRGRESQSRRLAKKSKPRRVPVDPDSPENILARSIRGRHSLRWSLVITMTAVLACIAPMLILGPSALTYALMIGIITGGTLLSVWYARKQTNDEHRWLRELPFEFDLEAYFKAMSRKEFHGVLSLKVCVVAPLVDRDGDGYRGQVQGVREMTQKVQAALNLGDPAVVTPHKDLIFTVKSPKFETWFVGEDSVHSNHQLHGWFRSYGEAVLIPLHKATGIWSVTVQADDA